MVSTLSLVDLAGSESVRLANTHGQRQIEGGFINKSLLTLGKVVSMLTEEGERGGRGLGRWFRTCSLRDAGRERVMLQEGQIAAMISSRDARHVG